MEEKILLFYKLFIQIIDTVFGLIFTPWRICITNYISWFYSKHNIGLRHSKDILIPGQIKTDNARQANLKKDLICMNIHMATCHTVDLKEHPSVLGYIKSYNIVL